MYCVCICMYCAYCSGCLQFYQSLNIYIVCLFVIAFVNSFYGVSATSICKARLVLIRLKRLEQIANFMIKASVSTMILFCVKIHEDVDDLYKWQTFWPSSLHQCQILHVDNNIQLYMIFIGS